ncbi:MAG: CHAT domain-containing protein [Coleofasciculus sp.]|uniref:CHAT domain-containing protein n=1 Tax=Coleofasciculus sp. TaxID=3100458 RepID=UPI003A1B2558
MMVDKFKRSLTQRAITSPTGLGRTKKLPFEAAQAAAPTPTTPALPEDVETETEEKLFPPNELYITMKLPPEVAILHIYSNGADEYALWGGNAVAKLSQTKPKKRPPFSLALIVDKKLSAKQIKNDMNFFSFVNPELRKWVKGLRSRFGGQLCLVIADHTNYEIPWEMVELSPEESPHEYLGTLVTTVRWQKFISGDDYLMLNLQQEQCCGNVIAYVLDTELNGSEVIDLEDLKAVIYRSSKHDINEFKAHLERNESSCGFIYISCHGDFRENIFEIWIGSEANKQQRLKYGDLRTHHFNLLKNSQGIVFINACHSGRHKPHPYIPSDYQMGFVELFMKKGARGVIGTLAPVGNKYGSEFARDLIKASLRSPNLSVAALLRELRFKMIKNFPDQPTKEQWESFIYTFMYVYYGNPMTVLRLIPPGGQNGV